MADKKISALTSATTPLAGTEVLPIVQGGATVKVTVDNLTAGKAVSMSNLTYTGTLTGGTGVVNLGSGQVYKDASGNVGIGTSSPAYKLDVAGAISTNNNLTFTGTGNRITGDFSNGTVTNRPMVQSSTTDGYTVFRAIPNGTGTYAEISVGNNSNQGAATSTGLFSVSATEVRLGASQTNSGTLLPLTMQAGAAEIIRLTTSGNVGIGTSTPSTKLTVVAASNAGIAVNDGTVNTIIYNSTGGISAIGTTSNHPVDLFANNAARVRIATDGIVTMNAYGAGAATFSAAGVISSVSDETWKIKDGAPVDPDAMLKKLEPGYWYYNDEKKETFGADRQLGFYAQNVNAAIGPEAAPTPEEGKPWGYYDRSVLAVTVMSLQKALATIESLTARIAALENK